MFYSILIFCIIVAIGLNQKLHKIGFFFSSKIGNYIYVLILFFLLVIYPYAVMPTWIDKLQDQLTGAIYEGEVIDIELIKISGDEEEESYKKELTIKTNILSKEIIRKIPSSSFGGHTVGDRLAIAYNHDTGTLIEASGNAKLFSISVLLSCVIVIFIIIFAVLYAIGAFSDDMMTGILKFCVTYLFFPIIFIGILSITSSYLYTRLMSNSWEENPVLVVLSVFFLLFFLVVSYIYFKVFVRIKIPKRKKRVYKKRLKQLPIRENKKLVRHPFDKIAWDDRHIKIALRSLYNAKLSIVSIVPEVYLEKIDVNISLLDQAFFATEQLAGQSDLSYRNQNHKMAVDVVREMATSDIVDLVHTHKFYDADYEKKYSNFKNTVVHSLRYTVDYR
ncbi:hypothetical protein [Aquimarina longa]|uniref:hypothetical protein n=1 Tax=Aquimarina longa TaxID=1080221 RepID=UPI000781EFB4|nr:hypothetical protein [Aquimarina longa]